MWRVAAAFNAGGVTGAGVKHQLYPNGSGGGFPPQDWPVPYEPRQRLAGSSPSFSHCALTYMMPQLAAGACMAASREVFRHTPMEALREEG